MNQQLYLSKLANLYWHLKLVECKFVMEFVVDAIAFEVNAMLVCSIDCDELHCEM